MSIIVFWSFIIITLYSTPVVLSIIDSDEACPIFPQVTINPTTVHTLESPVGQRNWVVLIWASCDSKTTTCEGSLIREDWVITSVGCLPCGSDTSVVVDVALHNSDIRKEMLLGRTVERVGAYGIHVHANYVKGQPNHDIALIHLTKKVNSSFVISLVECSQTEWIQIGRNCLSAGWGTSSKYSALDAKAMEDAYMGIWSSKSCERVIAEADESVICAGAKLYSNITSNPVTDQFKEINNKDSSLNSCYVQLGASLVISQPKVMVSTNGQLSIKCEWQLCGVLSKGMHCEVPDIPGIYTKVCAHDVWISDTIRLAEEHLQNLEGCPTLPSPPVNGYLCGLENVASGRVHFCCERGYEISGPSVSSCDRSNRQWSPNTGKCLPVLCPQLPTPHHGISSPSNCRNSSYNLGCWFSCDSGYKLKGIALLTCQEDGTWSSGVPNCEAIDCGPPLAGGNLIVDYTETTYQSLATYQCKTCYELLDGYTIINRTCDNRGRWRGLFPICNLVYCQKMTAPLYGQIIETSDTCGSQVKFQCMDGFVMIGIDQATCLPNGKWSSDTPFCVSANCPHPVVENSINFLPPTVDNPPPKNYFYGDRVTIHCENCHKPIGGRVDLTCLEGGTWDGSPPVCEWVTCPLPSLLPNGQIYPLGNMYFCGTHVRFRCYPGYNMIGSPSTHCGDDGKWSNPFPTCQSLHPETECSLFEVQNGKVSITHTGPGGAANVSCNQCYSLDGQSSLKCTEMMEWDQPIPSCKRRQCPELGDLANGYIMKQSSDSTITCNDVILFECQEGFELDGAFATTCLYNGKWSHPTPVCKAIKCLSVPLPTTNSYICGATVFNESDITTLLQTSLLSESDNDGSGNEPFAIVEDQQFPPGSSIEYCCREGTIPDDDNETILTCTELGKWNKAAPQCKNNGCPLSNVSPEYVQLNPSNFPSIVNKTTQVYPNGTVLNWVCKQSDMNLFGMSETMCLYDNKEFYWNKPLPQCINRTCFQTCSYPIVPENGRIVSLSNNKYKSYARGISEGTVVIYLCNRNYILHGSISRKCLVNGVWSGQETMCLRFIKPSSKLIVQNPETKQWQSVSAWHFMTSQQVYLACQTFSGQVVGFNKINGPVVDTHNVRVSEFGEEKKSRQLLMKPMNPEGAKTIEGTYVCQVIDDDNVINRTMTVSIHDNFCSISDVRDGSIDVSGQVPGACQHVICNNDEGYRLLTVKREAFRMCMNGGIWSELSSVCVLE